jgi:hypothetical protein
METKIEPMKDDLGEWFAVIEPDGTNFIYKVWFSSNRTSSDVLACLFKNKDGKLELRYRFRYYTEQDPWSESDRKRFHRAIFNNEEKLESASEKCDLLFSKFSTLFGYNETDAIDVNSADPDTINNMLLSRPWCHAKQISTIEA